MKQLAFIIFLILPFLSKAQEKTKELTFSIGPVYNGSSSKWNSTTGLGLLLEANYFLDNKIRLGARFEPTALANGEIVYPGGCQSQHPRYPGINSCAEGANFLFNNYLKVEYMLGEAKYGAKNRRKQTYLGFQAVLLTHQRYIITSREPGNWLDTRKRVTGFGGGLRFGAVLGKFDLSSAYTVTSDQFRGFIGINLAYRFLTIKL